MAFDFKTIPNFSNYIGEKMGVIERELYDEKDVKETSYIINKFMKHISVYADDDYELIERMFNEYIHIIYKPNCESEGINGITKNGIIYIYKRINKSNYLDVKYTLTHEIVHVMQQILSRNEKPYEDLSTIELLRKSLIEITTENIEKYKKSKSLSILLYLIDINEVYSRNQNAYITAFNCKYNNAGKPNQEIINYTFRKIGMSNHALSLAINELKTDNDAFFYVISFLIGNFFELGKSGFQRYFDKRIFQLSIIVEMRKELKDIIYNTFDIDELSRETIKMVKKYKKELINNKDVIIDSFIEHMSYWFIYAQKRLGKAIQLGIDDACEKIVK